MSGSRASSGAKPTALIASVVLGGALAGIAFGAAGGTALARTTVVEICMVVVGGLLVAGAVLVDRRRPYHGATALAAFAALAALTALSVLWSVVPELSYIEAGRSLAYLFTFAAAVMAARVAPQGSPVVLHGILLAAVAAVGYSLASRVWPGTLAEHELSNRIGAPFQYWNAVGTTAAMVVPAALWLGSRRSGSGIARALAYPALGAAVVAILLTQSRGALAAGAIGAAAWFAFVPLRLRSLPVLVLPSLAAGGVGAWALSKDAFAKTLQPLSAKQDVAAEFGLLLLVMTLLLLAVGLAVNVGLARGVFPARLRRRIGVGAVAVACAIPLVAFTSVAFSDRGLGGTIGDRVDELTSETDTAPIQQGAGRFSAASSTRGKYWREAGKVFAARRSVGTGAGAFAVTRLRHRTDTSVTRHAHGYVVQTLADLGLVGLAVSLALLIAWLVAAGRTTALYPRRLRPPWRPAGEPPPRRDWPAERAALVAVALVAIVFGLQSAIDWTWFVPGPAAMAFVAAGFVAGRGPVLAVVDGGSPAPPAPARQWPPGGARVALASLVVATVVLTAWAIWQPRAAEQATDDAVELAAAGDLDAAIAKTGEAEDANPLSPEPLLVRAAIETAARRERDAKRTLERAVLRYPGDPETWLRLASFQLGTLDRADLAVQTVQGALFLDPRSTAAAQLFLEARIRQREKRANVRG